MNETVFSNRKTICIISFSPIYRDSRVLRQIKYLAPYHDLSVIGYGEPHPDWERFHNIHWLPVQPKKPKPTWVLLYLLLGKVYPKAYEHWYWLKPQHQKAFEYLTSLRPDVIYANEWDSLPIAACAASSMKTSIIFDAHEYTLGQYQSSGILKRWLVSPNGEEMFQCFNIHGFDLDYAIWNIRKTFQPYGL